MEDDPTVNQTQADVAAYYTNAKIGDPAAIRQTQGGILRIKITEIDNVKPKIGRLYLKDGPSDWGGSAFYRKTGKNCFAPQGQTRLVIPTPEVIAWVEAHNEPWRK